MAHLAIALMGPFEVVLDRQTITRFQSDKVRALLAYLAVEASMPHSRHAVAGLLWPDVPEVHALHSLSQALCNLRNVLHDQATTPPLLSVTPHTLQFNRASDCWLDVEEFGRLVGWRTGRLAHGNYGEPGRAGQSPPPPPTFRPCTKL